MGSEVFLLDIKIISLCRTAVKRGTQKRDAKKEPAPPQVRQGQALLSEKYGNAAG